MLTVEVKINRRFVFKAIQSLLFQRENELGSTALQALGLTHYELWSDSAVEQNIAQ